MTRPHDIESTRIGLIGGMSWRASAEYYRIANVLIAQRFGTGHSARVLLDSLDFAEVLDAADRGGPHSVQRMLVDAALRLQGAGVDAVLLTANTAHRWYGEIAARLQIPLLHVADAVHARAAHDHLRSLAIVGTTQTVTSEVYEHGRGEGVELLYPDAHAQLAIDRIIEELTRRAPVSADAEVLRDVGADLERAGAEAIVLACTDLSPLQGDLAARILVLDSAEIHVAAALS